MLIEKLNFCESITLPLHHLVHLSHRKETAVRVKLARCGSECRFGLSDDALVNQVSFYIIL